MAHGEIYPDKAGKWRHRFQSANGKFQSTSGEAFASKANAKRALVALLTEIRDLPVEIRDPSGKVIDTV